MTLDGKKSAKGFPIWKDPYKSVDEINKEFTELALEELNKEADIYFIDEIGIR